MKLRTFCSITIIPTLILILLLLSSVDNYLPENQIYGQLTNPGESSVLSLHPIDKGLSFHQNSILMHIHLSS